MHRTRTHLLDERSASEPHSREIAQAEADYERFRKAYLSLAVAEPDNYIALAMIGADMDRAHARLQSVAGLRSLPFTHDSTHVVARRARELVAH